eukprot:scaffold8212_cov93-Cylindrotheca_fusiformis.AAC.14
MFLLCVGLGLGKYGAFKTQCFNSCSVCICAVEDRGIISRVTVKLSLPHLRIGHAGSTDEFSNDRSATSWIRGFIDCTIVGLFKLRASNISQLVHKSFVALVKKGRESENDFTGHRKTVTYYCTVLRCNIIPEEDSATATPEVSTGASGDMWHMPQRHGRLFPWHLKWGTQHLFLFTSIVNYNPIA